MEPRKGGSFNGFQVARNENMWYFLKVGPQHGWVFCLVCLSHKSITLDNDTPMCAKGICSVRASIQYKSKNLSQVPTQGRANKETYAERLAADLSRQAQMQNVLGPSAGPNVELAVNPTKQHPACCVREVFQDSLLLACKTTVGGGSL